jgi:hypothetical protein
MTPPSVLDVTTPSSHKTRRAMMIESTTISFPTVGKCRARPYAAAVHLCTRQIARPCVMLDAWNLEKPPSQRGSDRSALQLEREAVGARAVASGALREAGQPGPRGAKDLTGNARGDDRHDALAGEFLFKQVQEAGFVTRLTTSSNF